MTLTKNEKIAAGVGAAAVIGVGIGAAAVIGVGIGAAVAASKAAVTTPPPPTDPFNTSITVSPTTELPSSGGTIDIRGMISTNPANPPCPRSCSGPSYPGESSSGCSTCFHSYGADISILINGKVVATQSSLVANTFFQSFLVSANTGTSAEILSVQVATTLNNITLKSNAVTVEVAGTSTQAVTISVTPTSLPQTGGTITISGTTRNIGSGGFASLVIDGSPVAGVGMTLNSDGTFSGTFKVSANTYYIPETTDVQIWIRDHASKVIAKSNIVGVTVAGLPWLSAFSVTPTSLPQTGGTITISGKLLYPTTLGEDIQINIGTAIRALTLPVSSDLTFSGTYDVPANEGNIAETLYIQAWTFIDYQEVKSDFIAVTVAGLPPLACTVSVTPTSLPSNGGMITISTAVENVPTGPAGTEYVDIHTSNSGIIDSIPLNGSGTVSASYDVAANTSTTTIIFSVWAVLHTFSQSPLTSNAVHITVAAA